MQRNYPSSSVGINDRSSIRRRSGAYSPRPDNHSRKPSSSNHINSPYLTVQVEDVDAKGSRPTVLLVQPTKSLSPLPDLTPLPLCDRDDISAPSIYDAPSPMEPDWSAGDVRRSMHEGAEDREVIVPFSPIPLTPRPNHAGRAPSSRSVESSRTSASKVTRLPTPDFLDRNTSARPYLPRLFSVRGPVPLKDANRPSSSRLDSISSTSSLRSSAISTSSSSSHALNLVKAIKNKRPALLPSLSTTDKLTHKFPVHRSVRSLATIGRGGGTNGGHASHTGTLLGEGQGLGIERVDRWTSHKWCLFLSVWTVFVYGLAGLVCAVLTWFRTWDHADVMYVCDYDILVLITIASAILLLTFLVGITGTILNSRPILAVYALLLWPALISMLSIGYTSYKRYTFSLDRKLNLAWSQWYTPLGRLIIQDSLHCCGFYSALHEVTQSKRCYVRTSLPGCKAKLYAFERMNLGTIWSAVFALVPVHIMNIFVALLCANHVTRMFGKGIMPRQYRLSGADVRADAERIFGPFGQGVVRRPDLTRASSSGVFREDKEECLPLLEKHAVPGILRPGFARPGQML